MHTKSFAGFIFNGFGLVILLILFFAGLTWLKMPCGSMVDWMIGIATAWWLLAIVTVPWNVYFEAKGVLSEAEHSRSIGISVDEKQQKYVTRVSATALGVAIGLHVLSAAALFALSSFHISPVGYIGSAAALLLTVLRPSVRAYEYLWEKLRAIKHRVKYPREDVVELRNRTATLEGQVKQLTHELDLSVPNSFAAHQNRSLEELKHKQAALLTNLNKLVEDNDREHQKILREGQMAIAKISSDSQFLDHVREIVRLIKSA
jgi:hypothetical protein